MAETAALFLAYSELQSSIRYFTKNTGDLSIAQLGLAAGGAGFLTSFILSVRHVDTRFWPTHS